MGARRWLVKVTMQSRVDASALSQVLQFLQELIFSVPSALADLQRESEEEAGQRHERMVACSLLALAGLIRALPAESKFIPCPQLSPLPCCAPV